ncbi:modulator of drug activity B [Pseudomonas cuatrocienegasensis]|uniref:Modulator of drug activity B n=1 Tax=Pseudomonas cuatrocienegasensis TaxID=543360 RepID=A0ABY1BG24_9PSED|nr:MULTISPECIES: NAD(P)H-dependent oxidoreductase [Pseudomonas]OEC35852.1 flavodoxin [Pseudomonas sp. 21C1]SEQ76745.1 modulator of drug activity B [Pseudomonas cuatrocienegasensis]
MKKVLLINAHHPYSYSPGRLNATLIERAESYFRAKGYEVEKTVTAEAYDVDAEVEKIRSADVVFLQMPLNWMGVPWSFKKYTDEVWGAGLFGKLSNGDGRSSAAPKDNYGMGGVLNGRYMVSVTANAPSEAFNDPAQAYFAGRGEDDLTLPIHLNFKWIGLEKMPSFWAYDVMKNPQIESDLARFDEHLATHF